MTSRETHIGSRDVCPSCNTRLRISLQGTTQYEFVCPECGDALQARLASDERVEISSVPTGPLTELHAQSIAPVPPELRLGRSRMIAAAIAASVGLIVFMLWTPSTDQSEHQNDIAASVSSQTVDNVNNVASADSTGPVIEADRLPDDASLAESDASSPLHNLAIDSANRSESEPNVRKVTPQQTATGLTELPIDLLNLPPRAVKPRHPAGSVQQVAGTDETTNPDSQEAATVGKPPPGDDVSGIGGPDLPVQPIAKPMNVESRLGISIRSFRQTKPVPLRDLIRTIETMCRVRVDVSAVPPKLLAAEVTVSLRETTPLKILTEVGRKHGLRAIVGESSVQLISLPN
jgi:predicted RNA-binding Zn-ribbon protein involved in translation (DUF1610 family)